MCVGGVTGTPLAYIKLHLPGCHNCNVVHLVKVTLETRQSEMANTFPGRMPVLGNVHPENVS